MSNPAPRPCIYCNTVRPFTDEHMFPKGLGGDDRRFMLREMVCGRCNTDVFSKLEASFMRSSPAAIARVFLQKPKGSGNDAIVPKFDTKSTTVVTPDYGEVEAEMLAEGVAHVLPQLLFTGGNNCACLGGDESAIPLLVSTLRECLGETLSLICKTTTENGPRYDVTICDYQDGRYSVRSSTIAAKPPKIGIWHEQFPVFEGTQRPNRHPTLYTRTAGQVVLRTGDDAVPCELLTSARAALKPLGEAPVPAPNAIQNPSMLFTMSVDMDAYSRVLAKIGLNLVAHSFGEEYIRHPAFDNAKAAVLGKTRDGVQFRSSDSDKSLGFAFSGLPRHRHGMTVMAFPTGDDMCAVALVLRLYNSITYAVLLGDNAPPPPRTMPRFHVVDYNAHRIEELEANDFYRKYPPSREYGPGNHSG